MALDRIMKQNPGPRTKQAEISRDIQKAITETFAQTEASAFMAFIAELIETYGVMNLSKETGIDRVTLWRFMRGDRLPRLDTFQKILSVLGIKVQFSFEKRMQHFLEYTYWRKQWETEHRNSIGKQKANGSGAHPTEKRIAQ